MPPKFRLFNEGLNYKVAKVPTKEKTVPRYLTTQRKQKLNNFLKKVDIQKEKEKLFYILAQKCYIKYPGSRRKVVIDAFVQELIENRMSVSQEDVERLDAELQAAFTTKSTAQPTPAQASNSSVPEPQTSDGGGRRDSKKSSSTSLPPITGPNPDQPLNPKDLNIPEGCEWLAINAYRQVVNDDKEEKKVSAVKKKNNDYLKELEGQIKEVKQIRQSHRHDDDNYVKLIYDDIEKYKKEEKDKFEVIDKKYKEELTIQKQQIAEKKAALEAEKEAMLQHEKRALAENERLIREEKEKLERQRAAKMEAFKKQKEFNEYQEKLHAQHKLELQEEDQRLQREAIERLDKEEARRAAEFKAKQDRLDHFFNKSNEEGGAGHKAREDERREELLLLRNQQKKEESDARKEREKEEARKKRTHDALQENEKILSRKKAEKEKLYKEEKTFGDRYRKESEDYIVAEKNKFAKIKKDNLKYQDELKAQMQIEKHDTDKGISDKELKLNRGVFKQLQDDPAIAKKVGQQLRIAITSQRA